MASDGRATMSRRALRVCACVLRDRESQLLSDRAARLQEAAGLPSLSDEVERLRDLLRRHGIDPQDGAA
jgi:hypothetical protein